MEGNKYLNNANIELVKLLLQYGAQVDGLDIKVRMCIYMNENNAERLELKRLLLWN